ncbi:probable 2-ketogluconate reductase [Montipora foliosa]|uniref:probable 2-ketogluconate reductase n=1 Tax=Montipora foliosa TaxID=591990 RepID=UPI0035F11FFF
METLTRPLIVCIPGFHFPPAIQQKFDEGVKDFDLIVADPRDITEEAAQAVEGLVCYPAKRYHLDGKVMDLFPNLKVISSSSVGVDHIDVVAASERGIAVGNTPGVVSDATADMAFALLMASARNVVEGDRISKCPDTKELPHLFGSEVCGSTIGIVGMGRIGSAIAKRAKGFDMTVLYHNRKRRDVDEEQFGAQYCSTLAELLSRSDFVVLSTPLTHETKHMITAKELSMMKPTATLVNISRGGLVNHADLTNALQNGVIRTAALDVTEPELLPRDHALLKLPNVILTPHSGTATLNTRMKMLEVALMNLKAGIKGEKLPFAVN